MEIFAEILGAFLECACYSCDGDWRGWWKGLATLVFFIAVLVGIVLLLKWAFG